MSWLIRGDIWGHKGEYLSQNEASFSEVTLPQKRLDQFRGQNTARVLFYFAAKIC